LLLTQYGESYYFYTQPSNNPFLSSTFDVSGIENLPINQQSMCISNKASNLNADKEISRSIKSIVSNVTSASSYKTCNSEPASKINTAGDTNADASSLHVDASLKITDRNSASEPSLEVVKPTQGFLNLPDQSSCDKVVRWLKLNPTTPKSDEVVEYQKLPASKEPQAKSQATSSSYPDTLATQRSIFSSMGATSRQGFTESSASVISHSSWSL
jgi:hypothetical protein